MSNRKRFKPGGTAIGFKSRTGVQNASVSNILENVNLRVNAQEAAKIRQKQQDNLYIAGLNRKHEFEETALKTQHLVNRKVRSHVIDTEKKRADTDVSRLQGIADQAQEDYEYLKELTPKRAKAAADVAVGAFQGIQFLEYIKLSKEWEENQGEDENLDEQAKQTTNILANVHKDSRKLSAKEINDLDKITRRLSRNMFWQARMSKYFKDNRKSFEADVKSTIRERLGGLVDKDSAYNLYETAGYLKLKELNISSTTKLGKDIIRQYRAWGTLESRKLTNIHDARETKQALQTAVGDLEAAIADGDLLKKDPSEYSRKINLLLNHAVLLATNGTYERKNGFEVTLSGGYGAGLSEFLSFFMQNSTVWKRDSDVWDFFRDNDLKTLPSGDNLVEVFGNERWATKAEFRINDLVENVLTPGLENQKKKAKSKTESVGNALYVEIDEEVRQLKLPEAEREEQYQGKGSFEENQYTLLNKILTSEATTSQKSDMAKIVGFSGTNLNQTARILRAIASGGEGAEATITDALSKMTKSERDKLTSSTSIEVLKTISNGQQASDGKGGYEAFSKEGDQIIKTMSKAFNRFGSSSPHESGKATSSVWETLVMKKINESLGNAKYKDAPPQVILSDAKASVKQEFIDTAVEVKWDSKTGGWVRADGKAWDEKSKPNNPFNYRTQSGGVPGVYSPGVIFVNQWDNDANLVDSLERWHAKKDLDNEELNDINPDVAGIQVTELSDNAIKFGDKSQVLKHVRLVSPDKKNEFINELEKDSFEPGSFDSITDILPSGLKKWADQHGIAYSVAVNEFLNVSGQGYKPIVRKDTKTGQTYTLRVSLDGTDVALFKTDKPGEYKKPKPYNLVGEAVFNTIRANSDITPMDPLVAFSVNNNFLNSSDSFMMKNEIETDFESGIPIDASKFFQTEDSPRFLSDEMVRSFFPSLMEWDDKIGWYASPEDRTKQLRKFRRAK